MNYVFYKGYTVYEDGTIIDVFGNPAQVIFEKRDGYYSVKITEAFGTKIWRQARFVWTAFKGEIPEGMQVDHINNNRGDDSIKNLQLLTPSENTIKARANSNADYSVKTIQQWTFDGKLVGEYASATAAEKMTKETIKANHRRISECAHGRKESHRGFVWKFKFYES